MQNKGLVGANKGLVKLSDKAGSGLKSAGSRLKSAGSRLKSAGSVGANKAGSGLKSAGSRLKSAGSRLKSAGSVGANKAGSGLKSAGSKGLVGANKALVGANKGLVKLSDKAVSGRPKKVVPEGAKKSVPEGPKKSVPEGPKKGIKVGTFTGKAAKMTRKVLGKGLGKIINSVYQIDNEATFNCRDTLQSGIFQDGTIPLDVNCRSLGRTYWSLMFYSLRSLIIFIIIGYVLYIAIDDKDHKIFSKEYKITIGVFLGIWALLHIISLSLVETWFSKIKETPENLPTVNYWADPIIYYNPLFGQDSKDTTNRQKLQTITETEFNTFRDKFNLQKCSNGIERNECESERVNKFYNLQNKNDYKKLPKEIKDIWEYVKSEPTAEVIENLDGTIYKQINTTTIKNKTNNKIVESPFLLVGKECKFNEKTGNCGINKKSKLKIDEELGKSIKGSKVASESNTNDYKTATKTKCGVRTEKELCEITDCNWNGEKCKKNWKPGEGYEIWGCNICDQIEGGDECNTTWRTAMTYVILCVTTVIMYVFGILIQFLPNDIGESDKDFDDEKDGYKIYKNIVLTFLYCGGYLCIIGAMIFRTLMLMCPSGSDMGVKGRVDDYTSAIFFNPYNYTVFLNVYKVIDLCEFWNRYMIENYIGIGVCGLVATVLLGVEFKSWWIGLFGLGGSLLSMFIMFLIYVLTKGRNFSRFSKCLLLVALFGWGFGIFIDGTIYENLKD